ncbi:porin [Thermocrinis sp.]
MRKSLLAMAALMGISTLPAHAWRVRVDENTFADITFSTQIWGRVEGARAENIGGAGTRDRGQSATNFYVNVTNIAASGQVHKNVLFSINAESSGARENFVVRDAWVALRLQEELRVQAGFMRVPFSRIALTSSYNYLIPTQATYSAENAAARTRLTGLSISPTSVQGQTPTAAGDASRDAGIVIWGNIGKDAMLKYYAGIFDGRYDARGGFFGANTKDQLGYTVRIQFTPTMLGFKGETGYTVNDTYLGGRKVLAMGLGYRVVGAETTGHPNNYSKDAKMFTVDMLYEQKFGDLVPNLQVGYIDAKDVAYSYSSPNVSFGEARHFYAQGQLLYDQVVGLGKPALAIRYEENKNKDLKEFNYSSGVITALAPRPKNSRIGVFANYYIKGQAAKVSFGVDSVNFNDDAKGATGKNYTDFTLHLQTQF